jgi:enamine deaminase RidA (YjgF/YER057c/UK114 family)
MTDTRFINPATMPIPRGYTQVVEVTGGRTIYIAGQVAMDVAGNLVGAGDLAAQTRQVFENLKAALDSVGGNFSHVVKFTIFAVDVSQLQTIRDIRDDYVNTQNPPTSTLVGVTALFRPEYLIEIEAIAVIPA